uniref:Dynein regulatory complex protein 12 n=1 Tax=Trypanosoma congolense (strain IL3000) TaxID=1068625 RepID=G0USI6_TRYCI|nr:conserved hypothetical protein [Trypanosoma congolense IL3000]
MPAKETKKPSKTEADIVDDQQINDDITKARLRLAALETVYMGRLSEITSLKQNRDELKAKFEKLEEEVNSMSQERLDILTDFTRQYKTEEKAMIAVATKIDEKLNQLAEEKIVLTEELKRAKMESEAAIALVRAECETLNSRIADMEKEFDGIMITTKIRDVSSNAQ